MNDIIINIIKKLGFKVRRSHYRRLRGVKGEFRDFCIKELNLGPQISPTGGRTVVRLIPPNGNAVSGEAICCDTDCYNRNDGINIALGRAIEKLDPENKAKVQEALLHNEGME